MSTALSIGQVANYKPLAKCGMEELACRQINIKASGGVNFARNVDGEQKTAARQAVLDLFSPGTWGDRHLHILTMPGLMWRFERKLLWVREPGWTRGTKPKRTYITSAENDRSIYFAAVTEMPGLHTPKSLVKQTQRNTFAEMGVKTRYATFFFANIDDMIAQDGWIQSHHDHNHNSSGWDAVWLDYTGPITLGRLRALRRFCDKFVREVLIVTALKARWNKDTAEAIGRAGGHSKLLHQYLGGEILHDLEYFDTSPMAQFAIRKVLERGEYGETQAGRTP